ncbi:MAG: hypothetical protein LCH46_14225 [Proteobacteria bacterium]|nr:hypothetical protein [Pseudomonadota bacterium]
MAVFLSGTVTENPAAFTTAQPDYVTVQANALVYGSAGSGVLRFGGTGIDYLVNISGMVFGYGTSSAALVFNNSNPAGGTNNLFVLSGGAISGHLGAIRVEDSPYDNFFYVNNRGSISTDAAAGTSGAIEINGAKVGIDNDGVIFSHSSWAIHLVDVPVLTFWNTGKIFTNSQDRVAIFVEGDTSSDFNNYGLIEGDIVLGSGADIFDNNGVIAGVVYLGGGEDSYFGADDPDTGETAFGGDGDDILDGYSGEDSLDGGDGDDLIHGGPGNDFLTGGSHGPQGDTVSYYFAPARVVVDLDFTDPQDTLGAGVDTISGFENLEGSFYNDWLSGDFAINILWGWEGDDTLFGGQDSEADFLEGGIGNDTYLVRSEDIIIEDAGGGTADRVKAFESFALDADDHIEIMQAENPGGTAAINLIGNDLLGQVITGNAGMNILGGLGGSDTLSGGKGKDTLYGGTGRDIFKFAAGDSAYTAFDMVKDYQKGALNVGDKFDFTAALKVGGTAAGASASQASIKAANGVATFAAGSGTTMADCVKDIAGRINAGGTQAGEFAFFKVNKAGAYYLFISDGLAGASANDVVVQLSNVSAINTINLAGGDLTILT